MKIALAILLVCCGLLGIIILLLKPSHYHVRFRLKVDVEDGGAIRSSEGVFEITYAIAADHLQSLEQKRGWVQVPARVMPLFILFKKPEDRFSVVKLNPLDLAGSIGGAVKLKKIQLELTEDPVEHGIPNYWPNWLKNFQGKKYLNGSTACDGSYLCLSPSDFKGF